MRRAGDNQPKQRGDKRYTRTPVTTYYQAKAANQSPFQNRPPKKNRRKYLFGTVDLILIIVLIAALIYSLILRPDPAVITSNTAYHPAAEYARLIRPDFAGLGSGNKITFSEAAVVKRIEKQFPEVNAASIELPFFSEQPKVRLLVSQPAFKLQSRGQTYVVDQQGIAVTNQADQPSFSNLPVVQDQSGFKATVGKAVLNSQAASFIDTVIAQSQRAKVPLSTLTLPAIPFEFDLQTKDQPYYVKFYLGGDANVETGQFLASRQKFAQSHITPSQYLDVRVAGKVFYK